MGAILVVCTGNICRSPSAEGFLRRALTERLGDAAPEIRSAGTSGWEGSPATSESVQATAERGVDIAGHVARRLTPTDVASADLIVTMAREHRDAVARMDPAATSQTFTLKELVRLLEADPAAPGLERTAATAEALRASGFAGNPADEDVADPLGMPIETYRAMAWELDGWTSRLAHAALGAIATGPGATR